MFFNNNLNFLLQNKEKRFLWIIFFGIIFSTILEAISIASIIPVFNIIVLEKFPSNNFITLDNVKFDSHFKILVLFIFVLIFFIKNLFIILFNFFFINFVHKLNINISNRVFAIFLKQDYIFFAKEDSKDFLQKITEDVNNTNSFLISSVNFFIEIIFILAVSIFLMFISFKIFLFCFLIFFTIIFIYYNIFKKKITKWSFSNRDSSIKIKNLVIEGINGIKDIIIYKLDDYFSKSFNENSVLANHTRARIDFLNNVQKYWLELVTIFALTLALTYFVFSSVDISKLIPVFGVFIFALFRLLSSFNRVVIHGQNIKFNYISFLSIVDYFKKFSQYKKNLDYNKKNISFDSKIEFKNVCFFYDHNSNMVINDINLEINKGDCVGIFGKNASGKSTFLNLISGFINPTRGSIIIDDEHDLYTNRYSWNQKLSYVQQNIFLLDSTIKHNICLVDENQINQSKLMKIFDCLQLRTFFNIFPHKLETRVGNNGLHLSGGQKQIISLARALYKDSEIIILDEPSSALDYTNTQLLKNIIQSLKGQKTIFMVTHEKDLFNDCFNRIIKINSGKII
jgi:ABC-type multidrug transport system fused ATPase/permease subunit